jgi:hypothetical protein
MIPKRWADNKEDKELNSCQFVACFYSFTGAKTNERGSKRKGASNELFWPWFCCSLCWPRSGEVSPLSVCSHAKGAVHHAAGKLREMAAYSRPFPDSPQAPVRALPHPHVLPLPGSLPFRRVFQENRGCASRLSSTAVSSLHGSGEARGFQWLRVACGR